MHRIMRPFAVALCAVAFAFTAPAQSATPKSTFVIAKDLADIITMDPAEVFELTAGEVIANLYDRIMMFEAENLTELVGGVAESYAVSEDGKTITFRIRDGLKFHSGNPVRPRTSSSRSSASSSSRRHRRSSSPSSDGTNPTSTT